MTRTLRIYYNGLFGAAGGLMGWLLFGLIVDPNWPWYWVVILGGAIIGSAIGYLICGWEALVDLSAQRFLRMGFQGAVLGALGGTLGMVVSELVNFALQDLGVLPVVYSAILARGLGWSVFGLAVGLAQGWVVRSWLKTRYGAIGGALGGFLGGALFAALLGYAGRDEITYGWGQAVGLMVLGACIGWLIAAVEEALKPAVLRVLRGWREGREFPLLKPETVIGRDEKVDILLLRDMKVEKRHAKIIARDGRYYLENLEAPPANTLVDHQPITGICELREGARVQLGEQVLIFELRAARRAGRGPGQPLEFRAIPEAILLPEPPRPGGSKR